MEKNMSAFERRREYDDNSRFVASWQVEVIKQCLPIAGNRARCVRSNQYRHHVVISADIYSRDWLRPCARSHYLRTKNLDLLIDNRTDRLWYLLQQWTVHGFHYRSRLSNSAFEQYNGTKTRRVFLLERAASMRTLISEASISSFFISLHRSNLHWSVGKSAA